MLRSTAVVCTTMRNHRHPVITICAALLLASTLGACAAIDAHIQGEYDRYAPAGLKEVIYNKSSGMRVDYPRKPANHTPGYQYRDLLLAIEAENVEALKAAIAEGQELNPVCANFYHCKPLAHAAGKGNLEMVRLLIEAGADPNGTGTYGDTAFHYAFEGLVLKAPKRLRPIWRYLLENGADPNQPNAFGYSPFISIAMYGDIELMELAVEKGADPLAMHYPTASEKGKLQTNNPVYAITLAAKEDQIEVVAWLLKRGADPLLATYAGMSALDFARKNENAEMIRLIEAAGGS